MKLLRDPKFSFNFVFSSIDQSKKQKAWYGDWYDPSVEKEGDLILLIIFLVVTINIKNDVLISCKGIIQLYRCLYTYILI